jgi:hypothetical protein
MALLLRRLDVPPRKRYSWEDEPADEAPDEAAGPAGPQDWRLPP